MADIGMLVIGEEERSKSQWTELLQSEGLRVIGFYGEQNAINGVIEAVLAEMTAAEGRTL